MSKEQKQNAKQDNQKPQFGRTVQLKPNNPWETTKRLFSYFRYNKLPLFGGLFLIMLSSAAQIGANALLSPIFDSFFGANPISTLTRYLVIMAVLVIGLSVAQYLGSLLMAKLAQNTIHRMRADMFTHMQSLPIQYFDTNSHGDLMSTFTNDVDMLTQSLEQSLSQIVISFVTVVGTFSVMIVLSPLLTLIVIGMLVVMGLVIRVIGSRSAKNFRMQQGSLAELNGYTEEMMSGQKVVKVFNREGRAIEDFAVRNDELRKVGARAQAYSVLLMPIMGNLSLMLYAIVAMVGAFLALAGQMTVGNIAAFLQFTRTISRPITQLSNQFNSLFAALAGAERIFRLLDQEVEVNDGDIRLNLVDEQQLSDLKERHPDLELGTVHANYRNDKLMLWEVPQENGTFTYVEVRGDIRMHDVDFAYVRDEDVLHDISLFAKPGQKLALVGSTGAGKTTITNLLNRFYEISEGTITFDGLDIRRIDKLDLRSCITMVLQDVHLFKGTVADNIRYGRLDATDEEVEKAAQLANAEHFIRLMPNGYDSELSSDGLNLSQGERQLLSIARAAVSDPVVLVLDEATSSVDTRTEQLIENGMDSLMEDRTTFAIAHRLSTVRRSNAIMVMENGEIIERGTHEELMDERGRYYDLNVGKAELT